MSVCPELCGMNLNQRWKVLPYRAETLTGLSGPANPAPSQSEEGGGVLAQRITRPVVNSLLKACAAFIGFQESLSPTHLQLNCFLTGPVWIWWPQGGLLRLSGSPPPRLCRIGSICFSRCLGSILHSLCFTFIYTSYISDRGAPHWCCSSSHTCPCLDTCPHSFLQLQCLTLVLLLVNVCFLLNTSHHVRIGSNAVFAMKASLISVFIHSLFSTNILLST